MELECWSEDWGIPSIDPESLKILAFAKFSGAPLLQKSSNNPFWSPNGNLPVFRHSDSVLTDFHSVAKHLKSCNYSADYNLTGKQLSEAGAFINMIEEKLGPALKYIMWIDTKNHLELTRCWYGKHLPFPLGLYYPNKYEKETVQLIESLYAQHSEFGEIGNDTVVETSVYKAAHECLTLLSNRLGDNHYMFGRSASSVDAVMYGYLAPLLKAPFPNNSLQNYLNGCTNLVKFVVRISQNYFPSVVKRFDDSQSSKDQQQQQQKQQQQKSGQATQEDEEEEADWPHQNRNKLIAGAVAASAMAGYAYTSGLIDIVRNIEIRISDDQEYEDDDEENEEE